MTNILTLNRKNRDARRNFIVAKMSKITLKINDQCENSHHALCIMTGDFQSFFHVAFIWSMLNVIVKKITLISQFHSRFYFLVPKWL